MTTQAPVDRKGQKPHKQPRNGLPNNLIDDPRIRLIPFFLAAYRAAQGPDFGLNRYDVRKRFGIGNDAFRAAINVLEESSRFQRAQPRKGGLKQYSKDRIVFLGDGRPGYLIVDSSWFIGVEELADKSEKWRMAQAIAVWVFMRSYGPKYEIDQQRIMKRFAISRPTASKLLKLLEEKGLIWRIDEGRNDGQFVVAKYTAHCP